MLLTSRLEWVLRYGYSEVCRPDHTRCCPAIVPFPRARHAGSAWYRGACPPRGITETLKMGNAGKSQKLSRREALLFLSGFGIHIPPIYRAYRLNQLHLDWHNRETILKLQSPDVLQKLPE